MSSLESGVISVLETLIQATITEMSEILPSLTTAKLNCVLQHNAKEAVNEICQLFSALHHEMSQSERSKTKRVKKVQKTQQEEKDIDLHKSQSIDRLTHVSEEDIVVVDWEEEQVIETEHMTTPTKIQEVVILTDKAVIDCPENSSRPQVVLLQDYDSSEDSCSERQNTTFPETLDDAVESVSKSVSSSTGLQMSRQKKGKRFICKLCEMTFESLVLLKAHKVVHVATKTSFSCSQCGRRFGSKGSLDVHCKLHTDNSPYACIECGKVFSDRKQLNGHLRIHKKNRNFTCKICEKSFTKAYVLRKHLVIHSTEKVYDCDVCGKRFNYRNNLYRHRRIHTGEKPFPCQTCGRCFSQLDSLKAHKLTHTGEKPHKCKVCNKGFIQKSMLRLHEGKHGGHSCFVCAMVVGCKIAVKAHLQMHVEELPVVCVVCGENIVSINTLKFHRHKSLPSQPGNTLNHEINTGDKPYSCSECEMSFRQKNSLIAHQTLHTGERPFNCDECGKRFQTLGNLRRHQRIHTGEKPFKCDVCNREFNQSNSLKAHMHIHTGEKQYVCDKCGKSFAYLRNLRSHKCVGDG